MNPKIAENNIAELEVQINALKISNQLLSKKADWLETELAMSEVVPMYRTD
jgi:hypothetical protein